MAEIETALLDSLNIFLAFARKRLNDPELAADAVQDALLKALKSPDAPNDQEKVVPWFYQILRRTIIELYRRQATRTAALENFAQEQVSPSPEDEKLICACHCDFRYSRHSFERLLYLPSIEISHRAASSRRG